MRSLDEPKKRQDCAFDIVGMIPEDSLATSPPSLTTTGSFVSCSARDRLEMARGFRTAGEGAQLANLWLPDVIVLNLEMPERDGIECLRELRGRGSRGPRISGEKPVH
jgi:CheY-like chemotaxis protein